MDTCRYFKLVNNGRGVDAIEKYVLLDIGIELMVCLNSAFRSCLGPPRFILLHITDQNNADMKALKKEQDYIDARCYNANSPGK